MTVEYFTLGMQVVIVFFLTMTMRLTFLNNRNAGRTMKIISETLQTQAIAFNAMILRLHAAEQRIRELEDAARRTDQ
jgi:C4-dicarboxylate transporter